ncbi:MAG: carbon monoxide dehydrogenase subunit G [Chloroflexi bacterium]|nr:carbon monoxide dehydrogenase subunit G [Chloroflexota bacterium]
MPLKLEGNFVVDAPRDQVWNFLFEVETLEALLNKIPGITVERLAQISEDRYEGAATIGVAMVKGKYIATITVVEKRAPESVKFRGDGKSGANWASGEMSLTLAEQNGKTSLTYTGIGNVGGMLASVGQRLIDTVGKHFVAHGTKAFAEELAKRSQPK